VVGGRKGRADTEHCCGTHRRYDASSPSTRVVLPRASHSHRRHSGSRGAAVRNPLINSARGAMDSGLVAPRRPGMT
jgi:hypothetical protein